MKKIQLSILEIKKYLKKRGFIVSKKISKTKVIGFDVLSKTFLSCLIIISIFFIMPLAINFTKDKMIFSKNYESISKNNFQKLLSSIFSCIKSKSKALANPST